jgi:hypothetical protein
MQLKKDTVTHDTVANVQDILCRLHGARLILLKAGTDSCDVGPALSTICNYIGLAIEVINKNEEYIVMTPDYPCIFPWDRILSTPACAMCMQQWPRTGGHDKLVVGGNIESALRLIEQSKTEIHQIESSWKEQSIEYLTEAQSKLAPLSQNKPARRRFRLFS